MKKWTTKKIGALFFSLIVLGILVRIAVIGHDHDPSPRKSKVTTETERKVSKPALSVYPDVIIAPVGQSPSKCSRIITVTAAQCIRWNIPRPVDRKVIQAWFRQSNTEPWSRHPGGVTKGNQICFTSTSGKPEKVHTYIAFKGTPHCS